MGDDNADVGKQLRALIVLESDEFKPAGPHNRCTMFTRQVNVSEPKANDAGHPFIQYRTPEYRRNDYTLDYYRRSCSRWNSTYTKRFWKVVDQINWCFQDLEYSNFNFTAIERYISRSAQSEDLVILCTGYYYYTKVLFGWLTSLFEKYNLDGKEKIAVISHIAMLGKNWYNLMIEDISIAEPIFENKGYTDFHDLLTRSLSRDISTYIAMK